MADFNKILTPGDYENGEINVVVEIPTGSNHKIEWDRKNACFMLDRIEPIAFAKPCNYGFIPQTLDEDGDELDVLLITDQPLTTGIYTTARILGVMKFVDDGEVDDKIIAVPADDRNNGDMYQPVSGRSAKAPDRADRVPLQPLQRPEKTRHDQGREVRRRRRSEKGYRRRDRQVEQKIICCKAISLAKLNLCRTREASRLWVWGAHTERLLCVRLFTTN